MKKSGSFRARTRRRAQTPGSGKGARPAATKRWAPERTAHLKFTNREELLGSKPGLRKGYRAPGSGSGGRASSKMPASSSSLGQRKTQVNLVDVRGPG